MKLLPQGSFWLFLALGLCSAQAQLTTTQLLAEGQTAYLRGDLETAKRDFTTVNKLDPRNQLAVNYLRMIQTREGKGPKAETKEQQLTSVIIPKIDFKDASLGTAIEYLRTAVSKASEGKQSVNFVLNLDEPTKAKPITLQLQNTPVTEVMRYIGELGGVQFSFDKYAISVRPKPPESSTPPVAPGQ